MSALLEPTPVLPWRFPCDDPGCGGFDRVHRPYAKVRGKARVNSISSFTDLVYGGGDGLVHYGAMEGATVCYWQQDPPEDQAEYVDKVRRTVAAMRQTDADLGTYTHSAVEAWAEGASWTEPEGLYEHDRQRLGNFINGIGRWWGYRNPEVLTCEFIVSNDDPAYVGTGDLIAIIDGEVTVVDWKTHRRFKAEEKKNFRKWDVQLSMLANAAELRHYHGSLLVGTMPWAESGLPRPTRGLIVSVGPEGQIREYVSKLDVPMSKVAAMGEVLSLKSSMTQGFGVPVVEPAIVYDPRPAMALDPAAFLD